MFWKKPLHIPVAHNEQLAGDVDRVRDRAHRLEIEVRELRERLDALEGRHASLSASVRGRLGGRPNRGTGMGNFAVPLPINHMER